MKYHIKSLVVSFSFSIKYDKIVNESTRNTKNIELLLKMYYLVSDQDDTVPFSHIIWHGKVNNNSAYIAKKMTENC